MTRRELPREEWSRLPPGCDLSQLRALLPDSVRVFVVEDEGGRIVGAWSLMIMFHAEGIWIDPAHRARGGVLRGLIRLMRDGLAQVGATSALTGGDEDVCALLKKWGAEPVPFPLYVWQAKS